MNETGWFRLRVPSASASVRMVPIPKSIRFHADIHTCLQDKDVPSALQHISSALTFLHIPELLSLGKKG